MISERQRELELMADDLQQENVRLKTDNRLLRVRNETLEEQCTERRNATLDEVIARLERAHQIAAIHIIQDHFNYNPSK